MLEIVALIIDSLVKAGGFISDIPQLENFVRRRATSE